MAVLVVNYLLHNTLWWWYVFINQFCPCHKFSCHILVSLLPQTLVLLDIERLHSLKQDCCVVGQAAEALRSQHRGTVLSICTGTNGPYLQDWRLAQCCSYLNSPKSLAPLKHFRLKRVLTDSFSVLSLLTEGTIFSPQSEPLISRRYIRICAWHRRLLDAQLSRYLSLFNSSHYKPSGVSSDTNLWVLSLP